MQLIIKSKVSEVELNQLGEEITGYIKFVVDVEKEILAAGTSMHSDAEQMLLKDGSNQSNLWGGGLDLETNGLDFDSMINLRPNDDNPNRLVLDENIRAKMEKIVRSLLR